MRRKPYTKTNGLCLTVLTVGHGSCNDRSSCVGIFFASNANMLRQLGNEGQSTNTGAFPEIIGSHCVARPASCRSPSEIAAELLRYLERRYSLCELYFDQEPAPVTDGR